MGKRSRRTRSSSTILDPTPFQNLIGFDLNKAPEPEPESGSRSVVFTIGSPMFGPNAGDGAAAGFGEFLKACFRCKQPIAHQKQVFMYGSLQAFCTPSCREKQMEQDGFED